MSKRELGTLGKGFLPPTSSFWPWYTIPISTALTTPNSSSPLSNSGTNVLVPA